MSIKKKYFPKPLVPILLMGMLLQEQPAAAQYVDPCESYADRGAGSYALPDGMTWCESNEHKRDQGESVSAYAECKCKEEKEKMAAEQAERERAKTEPAAARKPQEQKSNTRVAPYSGNMDNTSGRTTGTTPNGAQYVATQKDLDSGLENQQSREEFQKTKEFSDNMLRQAEIKRQQASHERQVNNTAGSQILTGDLTRAALTFARGGMETEAMVVMGVKLVSAIIKSGIFDASPEAKARKRAERERLKAHYRQQYLLEREQREREHDLFLEEMDLINEAIEEVRVAYLEKDYLRASEQTAGYIDFFLKEEAPEPVYTYIKKNSSHPGATRRSEVNQLLGISIISNLRAGRKEEAKELIDILVSFQENFELAYEAHLELSSRKKLNRISDEEFRVEFSRSKAVLLAIIAQVELDQGDTEIAFEHIEQALKLYDSAPGLTTGLAEWLDYIKLQILVELKAYKEAKSLARKIKMGLRISYGESIVVMKDVDLISARLRYLVGDLKGALLAVRILSSKSPEDMELISFRKEIEATLAETKE